MGDVMQLALLRCAGDGDLKSRTVPVRYSRDIACEQEGGAWQPSAEAFSRPWMSEFAEQKLALQTTALGQHGDVRTQMLKAEKNGEDLSLVTVIVEGTEVEVQ